jgi:ankyrin repeat protein
MMNTLINRSRRFTESKVPISDGFGKCRNWFRSVLLISLLSVSAIVHAGPIHEAARSGNLDQVQLLIVQGVDVNEKAIRDETPLIFASLAGNGEIVNYLLQRGANIYARNASGMTALHAAAFGGHADIVLLLITKGARVNDAANLAQVSPLNLAVDENHLGTVQELLKHGADVDALERNGFNAVTKAGFREHWKVVKVLLANGATCQPADLVGDWLFEECTTRASAN